MQGWMHMMCIPSYLVILPNTVVIQAVYTQSVDPGFNVPKESLIMGKGIKATLYLHIYTVYGTDIGCQILKRHFPILFMVRAQT